MFPIPLSNLLQANEAALASMITLVSQGNAFIDCTGHSVLSDEDLERLLALLPETWGIEEISVAFGGDALNEALGEQIFNKLGYQEQGIGNSEIGNSEWGIGNSGFEQSTPHSLLPPMASMFSS